MASFILALSIGALCIALGEYVVYNLVMLIAGLARSPRIEHDFIPPMTVVVPAYNEEKHIRRKLENVLASDYPDERLQVVVVDDGSTDQTAQIVREFEGDGVRLFQTGERKGKIVAQKEAFSHVETDIVAITDATILAPPDGFRKLAAHMADPLVGAVSAGIAVRNRDASYLTRVSQLLFDIQNAQKLGESLLDSAAGLFGQLSLIRLKAVGDFSTDVIYEDREFGIALRKNGYRARFEPGVVATYHAAETLDDFSRQKQRNIGAMTQSVVRHSGLLFNPRYGWYGMLIFPEYSLFRMLRVYLIAISFLAALVYGFFSDPSACLSLLAAMAAAVFGCYVFGTALLAPLVREPGGFLMRMMTSIPAMALVAFYLATASVKYFRGDFSSMWDRIKRDRTV